MRRTSRIKRAWKKAACPVGLALIMVVVLMGLIAAGAALLQDPDTGEGAAQSEQIDGYKPPVKEIAFSH